ncbi:MAG TPA: 3-methyl-2-oxobutanoate hydroxymethyltransferase [Anaerolineales bacterium]|nr:3-methyl-2-oxobutanoate hydroxymethyltransferase [Anaerolineales bacterium]
MSTPPAQPRKKITTQTFRRKKAAGEKITMLTAYDYPSARVIDAAGVDAILVGDSLGMVVLGYENTLPVTMEDMLHHCRAVARGASQALLVGDMPFMSYQAGINEAVHNAGRFLKETGMDAVKLEGGRERIAAVRAITAAGIPVMGHLGLTPQSVHQFGGFMPQAREAGAALRLLEDAQMLQDAGCFSLVLESIPASLAEQVSARLEIPTIGIGAGPHCDGQVLVLHDVLGLYERFTPRFARRYAELGVAMQTAVEHYHNDVRNGVFPAAEHSLEMPAAAWDAFQAALAEAEAISADAEAPAQAPPC